LYETQTPFLYIRTKCFLKRFYFLQSQSATVPVEIQIDSDDDDVGNIAEPLVVLSSTVSLEDQDVSEGTMLL
jgi:hypothetical protein